MMARWTGGIWLAPLVLALGAMVAGSASAAPQMKFTLRFDWLTPAGMACEADAPDAVVRQHRGLLGNPFVIVNGDLSTTSVTCTAPDGSRWRTALPKSIHHPLGPSLEGLAAWRPGAERMYLSVTGTADSRNRFESPEIHHFTRLPDGGS